MKKGVPGGLWLWLSAAAYDMSSSHGGLSSSTTKEALLTITTWIVILNTHFRHNHSNCIAYNASASPPTPLILLSSLPHLYCDAVLCADLLCVGTIEGVSFQPKDVPIGPIRLQLGSGDVIEGLETAMVGMRQGGKRRILVPPEVGYVSK